MNDTTDFSSAPELAALANDSRPAWLWSPARHGIVWANRAGLAFWGLGSLSELAAHKAPGRSHGFRHLDRLGEELESGRARVDRLRFFRHGRDILLTCKISAIEFAGAKHLLALSLSAAANLPGRELFEDETIEQNLPQDAAVSGPPESEPQPAPEFVGDGESSRTILDDVAESAVGANIVPFRSSETAPGATQLTGDEQDAFQAIADALDTAGAGTERSDDLSREEPDVVDDANVEPSDVAAQPSGGPQVSWPEIERVIEKLSVACFVYRAGSEADDGEAFFASRAYLDLFGYATLEAGLASGGIAALLPVTPSPDGSTGDGQLMTITTDSGASVSVLARLHAITWRGAAAVMTTLADRMPAAAAGAASAQAGVDLTLVFNEAFEAAIVLDGSGNLLHANGAATELFNLAGGDHDQLTIADLLDGGTNETASDLLNHLRDSQYLSPQTGLDVIGKVYGGADLPLNMVLRGVPGSESSQIYCATFTDTSRWREMADAEAQARAQADQANQQKTEFLSDISHEIRTSLNPVLGFSEAIIEERFGPLEHQQYTEYVRNIHESGTHLLGLVNDMLDLSKIEAGEAELNFASVDLNDVAAGCVKLMQPDANKERIIIRSNLASDMPEIVADQQSLRQIALNLLSNAVKYTGPGGQVIVSTRMTDTGEQQLRVRDTGRGMSTEELDTALKPFGRVGTARDEIEGTGLGLPITHALIEANRARFSIESAVGEGTLVEVTFPVNRVLAS